MNITIIPGEAEEYAPAKDIRTEAESDADYRRRLLLDPDVLRHDTDQEASLKAMQGEVLDALGARHHLIRIHTYISPR